MREEDKVAIAIAATNQNQQLALSPLDEGCDCCCTLPLPRYIYEVYQGSDPSQTVSNLNLTGRQQEQAGQI